MSAALETLALEKKLLLAQSSLCRLQLRRRSLDLRQSLPWNRAPVIVRATPALRWIGFGLFSSLAGLDRTARMIRFADRLLLFARLAGSVIAYVERDQPLTVRGSKYP